jgi:glutamate N-acetyltransferase / amino-acid N-acetyltransferase
MNYSIVEDGHISSPSGFRATGVAAGLREKKTRDLALVYSLTACRAAALFTSSTVPAAPVLFCQTILSRNREGIRAALINSGQANAGTGQPGMADAVECAKILADELEVPRDAVLLMSTGLIGVPLPMQIMRPGIRRAVSELDSGGGRRAALAILSTDARPKERAFELHFRNGKRGRVAGMIKGSHGVFPRLATLLCLVTTDLTIDTRLLTQSLHQSVGKTLARITTDRDSTPNDTVLALANGAADAPPIVDAESSEFAIWQEALDALLGDLGQQLIGEAAESFESKLVVVQVRGALSETQAHAIALAVAHSPGVRRAVDAGHPDWGTILSAIGASEVDLRPEAIEIALGAVQVMSEGLPCAYDREAALAALAGREVTLMVDLHLGFASATVWSCSR